MPEYTCHALADDVRRAAARLAAHPAEGGQDADD